MTDDQPYSFEHKADTGVYKRGSTHERFVIAGQDVGSIEALERAGVTIDQMPYWCYVHGCSARTPGACKLGEATNSDQSCRVPQTGPAFVVYTSKARRR